MIENVITDVQTLLKRYLPDALKAQDSAFDDGMTLDMVNDRSILLGAQPLPQELPAIVIGPDGADFEEFATKKKDVLHSVSLAIAVTDTDMPRAYKRLWRMMRAIENVMETRAPGYESIIDYKTTGLDYDVGPFEIVNIASVVKGGILLCQFRERQDSYNVNQV